LLNGIDDVPLKRVGAGADTGAGDRVGQGRRVANCVPAQYFSSVLMIDHRFSARALSKLSPTLAVGGAMPASCRGQNIFPETAVGFRGARSEG
jgi:hypothetical protein